MAVYESPKACLLARVCLLIALKPYITLKSVHGKLKSLNTDMQPIESVIIQCLNDLESHPE